MNNLDEPYSASKHRVILVDFDRNSSQESINKVAVLWCINFDDVTNLCRMTTSTREHWAV
jgi:hypothetical protein